MSNHKNFPISLTIPHFLPIQTSFNAKIGILGLKNPQSPSPNPHHPPHLPHFTLQNPKIALSRVSQQPPPRCSRGRGGGLGFTVICTGFAGWWTATTGRDGSTKARDCHHMARDCHHMARDCHYMARDDSTSMVWCTTIRR